MHKRIQEHAQAQHGSIRADQVRLLLLVVCTLWMARSSHVHIKLVAEDSTAGSALQREAKRHPALPDDMFERHAEAARAMPLR